MTTQTYEHRLKAGAKGAPLFIVFHGTGGDENQFFGLAEQLLPDATIVSPRGDVSEYGAARFFRRTGEAPSTSRWRGRTSTAVMPMPPRAG